MNSLADFLQGVLGLSTEDIEHNRMDGLRSAIANMDPYDLTVLANAVRGVQAQAYSKASAFEKYNTYNLRYETPLVGLGGLGYQKKWLRENT